MHSITPVRHNLPTFSEANPSASKPSRINSNLGKGVLRAAIITARVAVGIIASVATLGIALRSNAVRSLFCSGENIIAFEASKSNSNILNIYTIKALLKLGLRPSNNLTANAWGSGNMRLANLLIDNDRDIDAKDINSMTVLHHAASEGHADLVERLIEKGANTRAKECNGWTALHTAAKEGNDNVIEVLIEKDRGIIHIEDRMGRTAYDIADLFEQNHILELLKQP